MSKKTPTWLKVLFGLGFGFLGLMVVVVMAAKSLEEAPQIKSWEQWEKHREYIKSFSKNVMIAQDALTVHLKAEDYYKDGFYSRCNLDACNEYKAFIREARDASADGVLTPQELVRIAQYETDLKKVLSLKDSELKARFQK